MSWQPVGNSNWFEVEEELQKRPYFEAGHQALHQDLRTVRISWMSCVLNGGIKGVLNGDDLDLAVRI
jgi:hypothetical protein